VAEENYPVELGTGPFAIAQFLGQHPNVNLERLWQRLEIPSLSVVANCSFDTGVNYETHVFEYNLGSDAEPAVVLQLKSAVKEAYRYLIFNGSVVDEQPKLLGYVDVRAKYPPSDPVVLASNGQPVLILQSNVGTGSGYAAWLDTVYEVTGGRIRPVGSYMSRAYANGISFYPSTAFFGRPLSCEIKNGHAILTVAYTVEYSYDIPLFKKQQKVVLIGSLKNGSTRLDAAHSAVQPVEFDSVYNLIWLTDAQFLAYNRVELRAIALGKNTKKKQWLREYLEYRENSSIRRELLSLLN